MDKKSIMLITLIVLILITLTGGTYFIATHLEPESFKKNDDSVNLVQQQTSTFFEELGPQYIANDFSTYQGPHAKEIAILMYHDVIPEELPEYDGNKLVVDRFREQMQYLVDNNYYTLTLEEFDAFYRGELEIPEKSLMLTFDDGFNGMLHLVEPILIEYNLHAVSFIIGEKTTYEPMYFLDKVQIDEMTQRGYFNFESHSFGLHEWSSKSRGMVEDATVEEVGTDKAMQEELIGSTTFFCYPFGHSEGTAAEVLAANGYQYAVTTAGGYVSRETDPFQLPRIRINGDTSIERYASIIRP